jgi:type I restriction enzyme M protein
MTKKNFNERNTEDLVRQHFQQDPLFNIIKFEEQKSNNSIIKECLSKASKNNTKKPGYPEFIITIPAYPEDIIIIECKGNEAYHESSSLDKINDYAVDGVMHYSKFLNKEFNVWCIAASGQSRETLKVSNFYLEKNSKKYISEDKKLIDIFSYITKIKGDFEAKKIENEEITRIAIELNKELNDYSIPEYERCTLISAILLALQDNSFRKSYQNDARTQSSEPRPDRLAKAIVESIRRVLQDNQIDDYRVEIMINEYTSIRNRNLANKNKIKKKKAGTLEPNFVIRNITKVLDEKILPLMSMGDKGYDVLGRFYTEFIRYAGTDKKTGLVLTPKHIADFFCDLVDLNTNDIVVDTCCGTGSFLIASMKRMLAVAKNDLTKKNQIKSKQLIGIENRTDMFTYACSNMIMSGDGKSNIFQGDCFSDDQRKK